MSLDQALFAVVAALTTAICFLFERISRTTKRLEKQLEDQVVKCHQERVELWNYILAMNPFTCSMANCPARQHIPLLKKPLSK